jgi:radical SAM-linked protein
MSFGPALSLGISSLSEFFDIRTPEEINDLTHSLETLNEHSETGLVFTHMEPVTKNAESIQELIQGAQYFLPVQEVDQLEEWVNELQKDVAWEIKFTHHKTKQEVTKDLKDYISRIEIVSGLDVNKDDLALIHQVSPVKGLKGLMIETKVLNSKTIRPQEILNFMTSKGLKAHKPIKWRSLMGEDHKDSVQNTLI